MKLFRTIDEKLYDIGFVKMSEDKYGAEYERENTKYGYIQTLSLPHKANGKHLIQSYQKDVNKDGFNNVVGLTVYESKLALKKMKEMGFR